MDTYGYHFSQELAEYAVGKMENKDGGQRKWKMGEVKDALKRCGANKPEGATWGDVLYVFNMCYSDGFPEVYKGEKELAKATMMHLGDPDVPEGTPFVRWLAVQDFAGDKIKWEGFI